MVDYYSELYAALMEKLNNPAINWKDVAEVREKYGVRENLVTLRKGSKIFYEFINAGWKLTPPNQTSLPTKEVVTINADHSEVSERTISIDDVEKLKDSDYLLTAHGYDPQLFELTSARNSKWENGVKTLYASRVSVKPKNVPVIDAEKINKLFKDIKPLPMPSYNKKDVKGEKLLLISISDLHLNLKASSMITGNDYDCQTAEQLVSKVLDDILDNVDVNKIGKIVFTIGGDMLNADNQDNTTRKGTPQDCEKHLFEAFEDVLRVTVNSIYRLLYIAPVEVIYIPGNHDETVGWFLAKVLEAQFKDTDLVNIDVSPLPRKYYRFGTTLIMFTHSANEKQIPAIVSNEAREMWSSCKYTDVFMQHLHSEQVLMEDHNIRIQRLPTISAKSKWTNDCGFDSRRINKAFVYDKDEGLKTVIYTNAE